ncbi:MAG: heparinase II/III family protein [Candidatus Sumerlaeota bacterium]|nr:heparinase II/III family protein [Candidatus Sumerlaeota bacterium]
MKRAFCNRYRIPLLGFVVVLFLMLFVLLAILPAAPAGETQGFPKPDPAKAYAEYKIFAKDGDPLRIPKEDWEGARRRVKEEKEWAAWLAKQREDVDDWMARRRDKVEWICGWYHDFVSPKDASHLIFTPDEPGEETLHSKSDPKVQLTPKLHAAWVYHFRGAHCEHILLAARLHRLTGEEKYAQWAAGQLDFYADNFARWPPSTRQGSKSKLFWQTLDEAVNLIRHVTAARLLGAYATPERKQRWFKNLFEPQAKMLSETRQTIHNIACWHCAAVGHVALVYSDPALWASAMDSPFGIRSQLARGVTSDYLWYEQSLGYNNFVVVALTPFFEQAALAGRMESVRHEMLILENLALSPLALRFANGQLPTPADSGRGMAPDLKTLSNISRVFPTALGLAEAAKSLSWDTLLDPPAAAIAAANLSSADKIKLASPRTRSLESSRMAVLCSGPWQVYFHYGQLTNSHVQSEALNFEACYGDVDITHDSGTVGYGSPFHREYFTQGLAHNVPLINGWGQEKWDPGELRRFDEKTPLIEAAQPRYRSNASASRTLTIENGKLIDEATITANGAAGGTDDAGKKADGANDTAAKDTADKDTGAKATSKTTKPARLGLALHLQGAVKLPPEFKPDAEFTKRNRSKPFEYWKEPMTASYQDRASFIIQYGKQPMKVTFLVKGAFTVTHASAPDAPPKRCEGLYVETTGAQATFKTIIEPAAGAN